MTLERASELVAHLENCGQSDAATDLFIHFFDYFHLDAATTGANFAMLCGYQVVAIDKD